MHIVYHRLLIKDNNQVFRNEKLSLLLHGLRNPDTTILSYTQLSTDYADIRTIQFFGLSHSIRIAQNDFIRSPIRSKSLQFFQLNIWQIAGKHLRLRISHSHNLVEHIVILAGSHHVSTHRLAHGNKLLQSILILNAFDFYRRLIELNMRILTQLIQEIFFFHFTFPSFHN